MTYFKIAQKVSKYLTHIFEKICCQELSKIAQSGHTDHHHGLKLNRTEHSIYDVQGKEKIVKGEEFLWKIKTLKVSHIFSSLVTELKGGIHLRILTWLLSSVTRLGDLLDFGQVLKPLVTINLPKSPTFLCNFCKGIKIYHFSSEIIFRQLL